MLRFTHIIIICTLAITGLRANISVQQQAITTRRAALKKLRSDLASHTKTLTASIDPLDRKHKELDATIKKIASNLDETKKQRQLFEMRLEELKKHEVALETQHKVQLNTQEKNDTTKKNLAFEGVRILKVKQDSLRSEVTSLSADLTSLKQSGISNADDVEIAKITPEALKEIADANKDIANTDKTIMQLTTAS